MTPRAYYNENDPFAAKWLRNLIGAGLIMAGEVDERSIADVRGHDLEGFTRCHFFAGIGGWDHAIALAGWPIERPIWSASCPCQPLSGLGQRKGHADERHLWPTFFNIVAERRPATIIGEQVASPDGIEWLAGIRADMEAIGYACGAADLPSAGVGAPTIRQRIYWVADANLAGQDGRASSGKQPLHHEGGNHPEAASRLEHAARDGREERRPRSNWWGASARLGDDGLWRRIDAGIKPLAARLPGRMDQLRAYGNAINPILAAEIIGAFMDIAA